MRFYQWVITRLVPNLGKRVFGQPRSTVVMDNATIHKHPGVVQAIEAAGAEIICIERCFSYYKKFLRREMWAFRINPTLISTAALANCVNRKMMCNLYNGKALDGCIRNVPNEDNRPTILPKILNVTN